MKEELDSNSIILVNLKVLFWQFDEYFFFTFCFICILNWHQLLIVLDIWTSGHLGILDIVYWHQLLIGYIIPKPFSIMKVVRMCVITSMLQFNLTYPSYSKWFEFWNSMIICEVHENIDQSFDLIYYYCYEFVTYHIALKLVS